MKQQVGQHNCIHHAINAQFSGVIMERSLQRKIIHQVRSGRSIKKRLSFSVVLVLLILLVSVAAALVLPNLFYEQAAMLQGEEGSLANWSLSKKLELINAMNESGLTIPAEALEALSQSSLNDEDANRIADEVLVEVNLARQALKERYEFTDETFSFFSKTVDFIKMDESTDSYWSITYTPIKHLGNIGIYVVDIHTVTNKLLNIQWSLSAESNQYEQGDNWHSKIWTPALIDRFMMFPDEYEQKRLQMEADLGDSWFWTLEDKAALDQMYTDEGYPMEDQVIHVLPGEDDIQMEEAIQFVYTSIKEKYAVDAMVLEAYTQRLSLLKMAENDEKLWIIELWVEPETSQEHYVVEFSSPSKDIQLCQYYNNQGNAIDPVSNPAFLDSYTVTHDGKKTKDEIVQIAWNEMKTRYGFYDNVITYFNVMLDDTNSPQKTIVSFSSNHYNPDKVGTYIFTVDDISGIVESASWDLEAEYHKQGEKQPGVGVVLWSSFEYNQYAKLRQETKVIIEEAGDKRNFTFEQQAKYDTLYREAGYDRNQYYHGLPDVLDISIEEATQTAKEAVAKKYKLGADATSNADITYEFDVSDDSFCIWRVRFLVKGKKDIMYIVEIASRTGEVIKILKTAGSNG